MHGLKQTIIDLVDAIDPCYDIPINDLPQARLGCYYVYIARNNAGRLVIGRTHSLRTVKDCVIIYYNECYNSRDVLTHEVRDNQDFNQLVKMIERFTVSVSDSRKHIVKRWRR